MFFLIFPLRQTSTRTDDILRTFRGSTAFSAKRWVCGSIYWNLILFVRNACYGAEQIIPSVSLLRNPFRSHLHDSLSAISSTSLKNLPWRGFSFHIATLSSLFRVLWYCMLLLQNSFLASSLNILSWLSFIYCFNATFRIQHCFRSRLTLFLLLSVTCEVLLHYFWCKLNIFLIFLSNTLNFSFVQFRIPAPYLTIPIAQDFIPSMRLPPFNFDLQIF